MTAATYRLAIQYTQITRHAPVFTSDPLSITATTGELAFLIKLDVTDGLIYKDPAVTYTTSIDISNNGGATWTEVGSALRNAGVVLVPSGGVETYAPVEGGMAPGQFPDTGSGVLARAKLFVDGLAAASPVGFYGVLLALEAAQFAANGPITAGFPFDTYALPADQA